MNRNCPRCGKQVISASGLILAAVDCPACEATVRVKSPYRVAFLLVTIPVTAVSTLAVLAQQGVYAALLWITFPIAAIGYVQARYCPLVAEA